jgi:hypothetical protein
LISPAPPTIQTREPPAEIVLISNEISEDDEGVVEGFRKKEQVGGKKQINKDIEEKNFIFKQENKKRNTSATIFSEAFHSASQEASERMQNFVALKRRNQKHHLL